jgi:hypothetical protein
MVGYLIGSSGIIESHFRDWDIFLHSVKKHKIDFPIIEVIEVIKLIGFPTQGNQQAIYLTRYQSTDICFFLFEGFVGLAYHDIIATLICSILESADIAREKMRKSAGQLFPLSGASPDMVKIHIFSQTWPFTNHSNVLHTALFTHA